MSAIVHTIEIARPPDEVFRYATDPSRFTEWQDDVVGAAWKPLRSGLPLGSQTLRITSV